jgi:hypothetical protein
MKGNELGKANHFSMCGIGPLWKIARARALYSDAPHHNSYKTDRIFILTPTMTASNNI